MTLGLMARAAGNRPPEDLPCTVIVLGCQVLEDGRPSLMLQKRIDAAYGYLSAHPDAACVASGGLDDSETVTEAQCIRSTLVSMGIDEGRIYLEDRSRSTEENLSFSAAIIREQSLPQQAVIGNIEYLLHLKKRPEGTEVPDSLTVKVEDVVAQAHGALDKPAEK